MNFSRRLLSLILCLVFLFSFAACKKSDEEVATEAETESTTTPVVTDINPLTGESGLNPDYIGKRSISVTIQNNNNGKCRPQWGLCDADVVIEAEVESLVTKYLFIYQDWSKLKKAGPFRSVRVDFVEMAMGFDSILCHWGWSNGVSYGAKELLDATGYDHVNALSVSEIQFRNSVAPSGVSASKEYCSYTTGESIINYIAKVNSDDKTTNDIRTELDTAKATPFAFYDTATALSGGECNSISFKVGSNNATFTYKDGLYYGAYGSKDMTDSEGTPYAVANVVVLYSNEIKTMDGKGRVDMDLTEGTGVVASNGTYQNITWTKGAAENAFKFFAEDGTEFKFNKGKTYIAIARLSNADKTALS